MFSFMWVYLSFFLNLSRSKTELAREIGSSPWDVCAGIIIAEEAGL